MPPSEPWSRSPGTAAWDYSGWGQPEDLDLCLPQDLPYAHAVLPALYLAAFAVGLPGNTLVLRLLAARRGPRRLVDAIAGPLAAADLGFVVTLPLWAVAAARGGRWPFGQAACKLSGFALAATRGASALLLAALSAGRYLAVARPLSARPPHPARCARAASCGAWAAALLAALPSLLARGLQPLPGAAGHQCSEDPAAAFQALALAQLLLTCALPLTASLLCSWLLARRLRRPPLARRARTTSLRVLGAVEAAFLGSWLPWCALRAAFHLARLGALPLPCALLRVLRWGLAAATCLAFISSCANPIIYLLLDPSFRARARRGVCGPGAAPSALSRDDSSGCWSRARTASTVSTAW